MYNIRYHIASLVAVFLALAIGLILGGLVVRQGGFDSQQGALVASLRSEYNGIKADNTGLRSSLSFESGFAKQMTDAWIAGRLAGSTVVLVRSGADSEGADEAESAIKAAGGSVAVVTLVQPGFGLQDSQVASSVAGVIGSTVASLPTSADVAKQLVSEWTGASPAYALTDKLVSAGIMKVAGLTHSTVATLAIDVASMDHEPDTAGLDIASSYADAGLFALGAETPNSKSGVAGAASARKLSALDTLGTDPGRFTLVALFSGGQQGYYSNTVRGVSQFPPVPAPAAP